MRWLSIYTPETSSDSTLVSCMPSTEKSRDCFAEFAIFLSGREYTVLYLCWMHFHFIFLCPHRHCVNVRSNFLLDFNLTKLGAIHKGSSHRHKCQYYSSVLEADHLWRAEKEQDQEYSPVVHRSEYRAVQIVYRQHIPSDTFRWGNFTEGLERLRRRKAGSNVLFQLT